MAKLNQWEVLVGNVGLAHEGYNGKEARKEYAAYVRISKSGGGRAGGETVTLIKNGEPVREHVGRSND